jgi:hypothetical protein
MASKYNVQMKTRNFKGKYTKLRWSYIVGYVDHNDVVHSRIFSLLDRDDFEGIKTHYDVFGMVLKGWRWDYDRGLDATIGDKNLDPEDWERIREHLAYEYDIPFYENGYHNVQLFCEKMDEEGEDV